MNNRKGFTLVELLAVIAILAILVIIALPNVINLYTKAQKETFLTEAKKIHSEAEKKFISDSISNKTTKVINSEDNTKLDMTGEKLHYCVILDNNGKVKSMKVSNGKWTASLDNNETIDELTIDDLESGNLDNYDCAKEAAKPDPIYCTYDGELTQGAEYVNGQYTYRYKQDGINSSSTLAWSNIAADGWGVQLTDKSSTEPVATAPCTYINNKPIVSMSAIFSNSKAKNIDLSNFDTSNVTDMYSMFYKSSTNIINGLENLDTDKVINMGLMFAETNLIEVDLNTFNTSNVTNMYGMFYRSKFSTLDLSNFNTGNVTNMSYMFCGSETTTIKGLNNFDTSKVTNMKCMFNGNDAVELNVSSFNTNKVTNMNSMFGSSKATIINGLNNFDTSNVTDMSWMFNGSKVTVIDVSSFNTSKVTNMSQMFSSSEITTIKGLNNFNTSKVTNMEGMFYFNKSKTIDVSSFNTSKVANMGYMFSNIKVVTLDISNFDTSKVTIMRGMFYSSSNLKTIYVGSKFSTMKVTTDTEMFKYSRNLIGGSGTKYSSSNIDKTYARIDGGTSSPGYFTKK